MMLELKAVNSFYDRAHILFDVDMTVDSAEVVVLLGRNGAGKSTLIKTIIGLVRAGSGTIEYNGTDISGLPSHKIARLGIGYVPEERRIFTELSVAENLEVGRRRPRDGTARWTPATLFELFPKLAEMRGRLAGTLSGGEQQMLTIARTLMGNPRLLLLDEPSEGLAPVVVDQLTAALASLKAAGLAILLSEQNSRLATTVADRTYVMEKGRIRFSGTMAELNADPAVQAAYLSV